MFCGFRYSSWSTFHCRRSWYFSYLVRIFAHQISPDVGDRSPYTSHRSPKSSTHTSSSRRCWSKCENTQVNIRLFKSLHSSEPTVLSKKVTHLHRLRSVLVFHTADVFSVFPRCLDSGRWLFQRRTILLFLRLCSFHWDLLSAREREQEITADCYDAACNRWPTKPERVVRSNNHRTAGNGAWELSSWYRVRPCVWRESEIPSF